MKQLLLIFAVVMVGCGGGLDGYYEDTKEFTGRGVSHISLDIELSSDGAAGAYIKNRGSMTTKEGKYSVSGDEVSIRWDGVEDPEIFTLSPTKRFLNVEGEGMQWRGEKR